jgi:hypothetical protein
MESTAPSTDQSDTCLRPDRISEVFRGTWGVGSILRVTVCAQDPVEEPQNM